MPFESGGKGNFSQACQKQFSCSFWAKQPFWCLKDQTCYCYSNEAGNISVLLASWPCWSRSELQQPLKQLLLWTHYTEGKMNTDISATLTQPDTKLVALVWKKHWISLTFHTSLSLSHTLFPSHSVTALWSVSGSCFHSMMLRKVIAKISFWSG